MESDVISSETTLVRNDNLTTSPMGNELAMMDLESNAYFSLDDIGKVIWDLLEHPTTMGTLCDRLLDRFEVSRQQCEIDVSRFVHELLKLDIVQTVDDTK